MFKKTILVLISILIGPVAIAQIATQTDWSGGPGISGPVLNWGSTFDMESGIDWSSTSGELSLSYSEPMEHIITGSYTRANYACPVDIDGDGDMDVLGAAGRYSPPYLFSGRIDWWENTDGTGTSWTLHVVDDNFVSAPSICSADLDGDGDMDIIGAARGSVNDIAWWENVNGSGNSWIEHTIPSSIQDASSIFAADVDNDGDKDLLSTDASYNKVIWLKNVDGSGTNWTEYTIANFNNATDVYGADVDGDGDIDAVGASYNGDDVRWWENVNGSGTNWDQHVVSNNFNGARSVFASDVDGDGDTDILGAASLGWDITWWENSDGIGNNWIEHSINSNFNWAYAVYAADMDDDGDTDVLGVAYFGDDITWWENINGLGLTWIEHLIDDNFDGAADIAAADMDSDGDMDIIGVANEDADISWWNVTCCIGTAELASSILDLEAGVQWDSITWTSDEPAGTSLYFQVRSSSDPLYMGSWSTNITTPGSLVNYLTDGDQYVQYKVLLETVDPGISPSLEDVTLSWAFIGLISDFSGIPTIGVAPLDVQFTDLSIPGANPITSWIWDFGDGNSSSEQNPMHTYASPGDYTVILVVSDGTLSDTEIKPAYISVSPVGYPMAEFSADPRYGSVPLSVQFTDESIQGTYPIVNWDWDFGDGNSSSEQNPMHTYASPGNYTVMLTVSDGALEDTETKIGYISVYSPLVVDAGADQSIPAGSSTTLDGSFTGGSGNVQILWSPESLIMQQGILDPQTLAITESTTFYLTVTDLLTAESMIDSMRVEVFVGKEEISQKEGVSLYPNPFTDQITLSFDLPLKEQTVIEIFDISGRMVLRQEILTGERLIHITGLKNYPGGLYLLSIKNSTLNKQKKLIH